MLAAALKAFQQMWSPPFRSVLLKSVGFALVILVVLGIGLQRLFSWAVHSGGTWLETTFSFLGHGFVGVLGLVLTILASLGIVAGLVFLMPAVTGLVAGIFSDEIAEQVERTHYPADKPGNPLPVRAALWEGTKAALLSLLVYVCAVPFLLFAGLGAVIFYFAAAFLLGREYFHLAAMRFHTPGEAKAMRKAHAAPVFRAGLLIAAFVSIPIVNLATPLFATALMVHMHKRLSASPPDSPR
jgi:CysZ protein